MVSPTGALYNRVVPLVQPVADKVNEILRENSPGGPPPVLQLHVLFGEEPDLRVSEICSLNRDDIHLGAGPHIACTGKYGASQKPPNRKPVFCLRGQQIIIAVAPRIIAAHNRRAAQQR